LPSDDFYVFVGVTGGFLLILGALGMVADFGTAGRDMIKPAAPFILLAAVPFFAAIGVGIFYDLRPKFRKWNIERKSEEIHLQERERE